MFEIVIDTGGTFTDAVLIDESREISTAKFPTNVANPSVSVMGAIGLLAEQRGLTEQELLSHTTSLVIGTTLPTNCILDGSGAKCCLIYTKGFRDIPELGRRIPPDDIYNLKRAAPSVLIPRYLRFGVEERMQFDGKVLTPLNKGDVSEAVRKAKKHNVEVPIICFLHSYMNPAHEEKAEEIVKTEFPNVVVSSHILRRWVEYERLSTAIFAGYVKPVTSRFVNTLNERMKDSSFKGTLLMVTCMGGVAAPEVCVNNPALLIGSGPAVGPLSGQFLAELVGFENPIVFDMGGTSCDISMLPGRRITTTSETRIGDHINAVEAVDVASIGAGGGSIAWIDERNMLRVGPTSAGANPGPACYGKGGQKPTVTDANVVLGYIPPDYFLGGTILLDAGLAEKAIDESIAKPLGIDRTYAAYAISSLVEANMAQQILLSAVQKGLDPRNFSLVVGGGAGPVHAVAVAARLDIKEIYVPKLAAVFCAFGAALADYKYILERFLYRRDDEVNIDEIKDLYYSLEKEGTAILIRQGVVEKDIKLLRSAEMRYYGQLHDIEGFLPETKIGEPFTEETFKALIGEFHKRHQAMYGWSDPGMPVTISTLKLQAIGIRPPVKLIKQPVSPRDPSAALKRKRQVYFKELGGFVETPCYDADQLRNGNVIAGPAIIEEQKTTLVVPKGAELTVDTYGNYIIRR